MKTIRRHVSILAVAVIFAACAETPTDADGNTVAQANDEGVICESRPTIGSNLGRRACTTRAEREEAARKTREEIRNSERPSQPSGGFEPAGAGD